jgi:nitrogen fixation protein FixH
MAEITGRHVLFITVGAFGIIIAVNMVMAWKAISTFPGLEVENSYVASQEFDIRRAAQEKLGWTVDHKYENGRVKLAINDKAGHPVEVADLDVLIGRATEARDDVRPAFTYVGGLYEADATLGKGNWIVMLKATARDGTLFEQRYDFYVKG